MWAIRHVRRDPVFFALSPMPTRVLAHRAKWAVGARICAGRGQAVVAPGFTYMNAFCQAHPALIRRRRPLPPIAVEVTHLMLSWHLWPVSHCSIGRQ